MRSLLGSMEGLEGMWSRFSLSEEEEGGAEVSKQTEKEIQRLVGRWVLNVEAVGHTFKPLWKLIEEVKICDLGDNILVFDFEDGLDLERVLTLEPWMYDKHMVVFKCAAEIETIPTMEFNKATFWIQIHNVPEKSLTQGTAEAVGNTIGKVVEVADLKDDGSGNEFLRVRVAMDISKPLPRCRKLWFEGKQVGWVGFRYERLPNFCYWYGRVTNGERDCALWLRSKGNLRKEDQQFGEWLRVDSIRGVRKSITVIADASRTQAPWWRKSGSRAVSSQSQSDEESSQLLKVVGWDKKASKEAMTRNIGGLNLNLDESSAESTPSVLKRGRQGFTGNKGADQVARTPTIHLGDCSNRSPTVITLNLTRKWTKIARASSTSNGNGPLIMDSNRRPTIDYDEEQGGKRQCMDICEDENKENFQLVAGYQHHRVQ